ncbi:hypothetical protein JCM10213v2_000960 [Rhodosporidiobolus nylandii]
MALAVPASVSAASKALYRSLLRTALRMPDDHRRAFVVHRARSDQEKCWMPVCWKGRSIGTSSSFPLDPADSRLTWLLFSHFDSSTKLNTSPA